MGLTASRTRAGQPITDIASKSDVDSTGGNTAAQARRRAKGGSPTSPTPARHGGPPGGSDASLSAKAEGAAKAVVATTGVWRPFNFAKRKADQKVLKFTKSKYFQQSVDEAFDECDLQRNGKILASELYVAILLLYHRINSAPLGGGVKKPPTRDEVAAAMKRHDRDAKGYLTREEFHACAEEICPAIARGISRQLLTVMVATPLVSKALWWALDESLGWLWPRAGAFFHRWLSFPFDILVVPTIASAVVPILFASYEQRGRGSSKVA